MVEFIPINLNIHRSLLVDLNEEYLSWVASEMKKHYNINIFNVEGTIQNNKIEKTIPIIMRTMAVE